MTEEEKDNLKKNTRVPGDASDFEVERLKKINSMKKPLIVEEEAEPEEENTPRANEEQYYEQMGKEVQKEGLAGRSVNPKVSIDGANSVTAGSQIVLTAKTDPALEEGYTWNTDGLVSGVTTGQGEGVDGGSKGFRTFYIRAGADCKNGSILVRATGNLSGASANYTVVVKGDKPDKDKQKDEAVPPSGKSRDKKDRNIAGDIAKEGTKEAVKDKVKDKAKDLVKDEAKKLASKYLSKAALSAAWSAIAGFVVAFWPWILGAVGVIMMAIVLFSTFFSVSNTTGPSATGATAPQASDYLKDRDTIDRILLMSGDKDAYQKITVDMLEKLKGEVDLAKAEVERTESGNKASALEKIGVILADIEQFKAKLASATVNERKEMTTKLITDINALLDVFFQVSALPNGVGTAYPVLNTSLIRFGNPKYHRGTPSCPNASFNTSECSKGSTYMISSIYGPTYRKDVCDATDISLAAGTPIKAILGGKVVLNSTKSALQIELEQEGHKYRVVYGHVTSPLNIGDEVRAGETTVGTVQSNHLHLEIAIDGECIKIARKEVAVAGGKSPSQVLWEKMRTALNLQ